MNIYHFVPKLESSRKRRFRQSIVAREKKRDIFVSFFNLIENVEIYLPLFTHN